MSNKSLAQLTLVTFVRAKPSLGEELGRRLQALVEPARTEAGNINYDLHQSNEDPDLWMLYENWFDASDLTAHFELPYTKDLVSKIGDLLAGDMDLRRFSMKSPQHLGQMTQLRPAHEKLAVVQ
jgi:quinol monooxygenase YgiN